MNKFKPIILLLLLFQSAISWGKSPVALGEIISTLQNDREMKMWYPDGSITNRNQWTTGLNYDFDSINKTAGVIKKSNITGSVVIPPYVDYGDERYMVTSIGNSAFFYCSSLTSVTIPDSVTSIGDVVFWKCSGLTSVTIPDSVTSIGQGAFRFCSRLTTVTIGNGLTSIREDTFTDCSGLTLVTIGNGVTNIEGWTFCNCTSLAEMNFGSKEFQSIPTLSNVHAFDNVPTTCKFIIPDKNYDAWISAYNWSSLVSSGYQFIKYSDWEAPHRYELNSLASTNYVNEAIGNLVIPTVGTLDTTATNSQLTAVSESLTNNITLHKISKTGSYNDLLDKPELPTLNGKIYDMSTNEGYFRAIEDLIRVLGGTVTNGLPEPIPPANPKTVVTFGDGTSQEYDWSGEIDQSTMVNEGLFDEDEGMWTTSITNVVIGTNVTSIGDYAFYGCGGRLASVTIGNDVTSIGICAFDGCSGLTSITIPDSVTSIREWAFNGCTGLTTITCNASTAPTVQSDTFGADEDEESYTGRNTYNTGTNRLIVPANSTGYTTGVWADPLCNNTKCGFTLEYAAH